VNSHPSGPLYLQLLGLIRVEGFHGNATTHMGVQWCTVLQLTLILHYIIEWSPRFCNPKPGAVSIDACRREVVHFRACQSGDNLPVLAVSCCDTNHVDTVK
jgi:hypothetical protein